MIDFGLAKRFRDSKSHLVCFPPLFFLISFFFTKTYYNILLLDKLFFLLRLIHHYCTKRHRILDMMILERRHQLDFFFFDTHFSTFPIARIRIWLELRGMQVSTHIVALVSSSKTTLILRCSIEHYWYCRTEPSRWHGVAWLRVDVLQPWQPSLAGPPSTTPLWFFPAPFFHPLLLSPPFCMFIAGIEGGNKEAEVWAHQREENLHPCRVALQGFPWFVHAVL